MVAEIDALILEVRKFRSSGRAEPVLQRILETYIPAWQAVNTIAGGLPAGGTTGQALVKASNTNYDTTWATIAAVPGGADTEVQFNDANVFGGSPFFLFDKTHGVVALGKTSGLIIDTALNLSNAITYDFDNDLVSPVGIFTTVTFTDNGIVGGGNFYADRNKVTVDTPNGLDRIFGLQTEVILSGNGACTNAFGIRITSTNDANGTVVNNYGLYIQDQSGAGSALSYNIFSAGAGKNHFEGGVEVATAAQIITTTVALTDGAGAGAGTLGTAPVAGDPTKWIGINDNGVIRYVPAWNA